MFSLQPLISGPIRVETIFMTKTKKTTSTIASSLQPIFGGPIRVRTTFLTKTWNTFDLFRAWQAALQPCCKNSLIFLELGRFLHSDAVTISSIRFEPGSLFCNHIAGISLIRLELGRLLCSRATGIRFTCVELDRLLCSHLAIRLVPLCLHPKPFFSGPIMVRITFLTKTWNKTGIITSKLLKVPNPF